jgi:hypothetical protein
MLCSTCCCMTTCSGQMSSADVHQVMPVCSLHPVIECSAARPGLVTCSLCEPLSMCFECIAVCLLHSFQERYPSHAVQGRHPSHACLAEFKCALEIHKQHRELLLLIRPDIRHVDDAFGAFSSYLSVLCICALTQEWLPL